MKLSTLLALALALLGYAALALRLSPRKAKASPRPHRRATTLAKGRARGSVSLHGRSTGSVPMYRFKKDCRLTRRHKLAMAQKVNSTAQKVNSTVKNPGAGMGQKDLEPFEKVYMDGYMEVDCVEDYMYWHGDAFGDGKAAYELKKVSNVSIVPYKEIIDRADQEPMTHDVCFAFCRTVPDMTFFGITNGRQCYCAPYYKPMAGDDSMCDEVCDGASYQMCGGKSKSSVFAMHMCDDTKSELGDTMSKMDDVMGDLQKLIDDGTSASDDMQTAAADLQKLFGKAGDPAASELMQSAKVFAGKLKEAVEAGEAAHTEMDTLKGEGDGLDGKDFADFETAAEADALIDLMEKATSAGEEHVKDLEILMKQAEPEDPITTDGNAEQYWSSMYFVDTDFRYAPSTCEGKAVGKPLLGTQDVCATACDAEVDTCIGYSFFASEHLSDDKGLCFLLSKFASVQYYTGEDCEGSPANTTQCVAKYADFDGTTLKPDKSGKCKQCFKKATKADRCWE